MLNLAEFGFPAVPMLGRGNLVQAEAGLREHVHAGTMEICYLRKGKRIYHAGGRDFAMKGNDVFITYPDEKHGSGTYPHGKGLLYWIQIRMPAAEKNFLNLKTQDARTILHELAVLPRRYFYGSPELQDIFEKIFSLCSEKITPLGRIAMGNRILELLLKVIRFSRKKSRRMLSEDIQKVLTRIQEHPEENISVEDMARIAGLSVSRFKVKFREQTGFPPGEHVTRVKVEKAGRMLLRRGATITDVAFDLGFSSSQYFATVFKRITRTRPSEFIKRGKRH